MKRPSPADPHSGTDCDTRLDLLIHRPVARRIARFLADTPVSPNQVTLAALAASLVSALFFSKGTVGSGIFGFGFFYLWVVLDHADGELARMTGRASIAGKQLDDRCDAVASSAVLCGVFFGALSDAAPGPRTGLTLVFLPALVLNAWTGLALTRTKDRVPYPAVHGTGEIARQKKFLDHFTGREPFYLLISFTLACFRAKGAWSGALAGVLIAAGYLFGFGYWAVDRAISAELRSGGRARI